MHSTVKTELVTIKKKNKFSRSRLKREAPYHFIIWLGVAFVGIFAYVPMSGLIIAFKDFSFRKGILRSPWSGLSNFSGMFSDYYIKNAIFNTVGIFAISLVVGTVATLIFTLLLNEITSMRFKRTTQTISYLPHFISWAIMAVILDSMLSASDGLINVLLHKLGLITSPIYFMTMPQYFWGMVVIANLWKELGWSAIIYLAVISGIDETQYESAKIDGAGRFARMWYITLPSLKGIIAILLILNISSLTGTAFDQAFFLSNNLNFDRSNVLSYYVYTTGLVKMDFSYSTAIGLVLSCISAMLMLTANSIVKKLNGEALF
ncbi:MAG: ABC transporter permease subunit [Bacillota bacterium]|nr:ABC transporter permease subunit [Bacillota bacterium]